MIVTVWVIFQTKHSLVTDWRNQSSDRLLHRFTLVENNYVTTVNITFQTILVVQLTYCHLLPTSESWSRWHFYNTPETNQYWFCFCYADATKSSADIWKQYLYITINKRVKGQEATLSLSDPYLVSDLHEFFVRCLLH